MRDTYHGFRKGWPTLTMSDAIMNCVSATKEITEVS
jgi:hypothetical protein